MFTLHLLNENPWVVVGNPQLAEQIFKAPPGLLHAGEPKRILEPIVGPHSILLLDGADHMRQRR
jgi:cytochrome P450